MSLLRALREQFVDRSVWADEQPTSTPGQLVVQMSGRQSPSGFCKPLLLPQLDVSLVNNNKDDGPLSESVLKRQKFALFEKQCSWIMDGLYVSGEYVAKNKEILQENGITHIVNCVGAMYGEYFKDQGIQYRTLWLQDSPSEDIQCVLYDTFEFIEAARRPDIYAGSGSNGSAPSSRPSSSSSASQQLHHPGSLGASPCRQQDNLVRNRGSGMLTYRPASGTAAAAGTAPAAAAAAATGDGGPAGNSSAPMVAAGAQGRVLVHCSQGVSRSTTIVIAYIMWKTGQTYDQVYQAVRNLRGVCSPNIGFTCQLLQWQKRREKPPSRVRVYRIAPHCAEAPRYFVPRLVSPPAGRTYLDVRALDPRGCFLVHTPKHLFVWVGKGSVPWLSQAGHRAAALLQKYENAPAPIEVHQGNEPKELIEALQPPDGSAGGADGLCGEVSGISVGGAPGLGPGGASSSANPSSGGAWDISREPSASVSSASALSSRVPSMVPHGSGQQQQQQQQVGGGLPPRGFGAAAALPVTSWLGMEGPGGGNSSAAGTPAVPQLPLQQLGSASPRLRPPSTTSSPRLASQAAAGAAAEMSRSVQCSSGGAGLSMGGGPAGAGGSDSAAGSRPMSAVSGSSICSGDTGAMLAAKLQGLAVVENDEYSHDFDLVNREYVKAGHTLPVEPGSAGAAGGSDGGTPRNTTITQQHLSKDDQALNDPLPRTDSPVNKKVRRSESDGGKLLPPHSSRLSRNATRRGEAMGLCDVAPYSPTPPAVDRPGGGGTGGGSDMGDVAPHTPGAPAAERPGLGGACSSP